MVCVSVEWVCGMCVWSVCGSAGFNCNCVICN